MTKVVEILSLVASVTQVTFSKDYEDWEVKGWKISGKYKKLFLFLLKRIFFFSIIYINISQFFYSPQISGELGIVNEPLNSWLESPLLPWKPFYKDVGLCLRFKFQLPSKFLSTLKVYTKTGDNEVLIWKLRGFQGNKWNNAKVTWKPREKHQVNLLSYFSISYFIITIGSDSKTYCTAYK